MEQLKSLSVLHNITLESSVASKFEEIFNLSHFAITGSWHNGKISADFFTSTSGHLRDTILNNKHISSGFLEGADAVFGIKDYRNNLWVGLEFKRETIYLNTSFGRKFKYEDCTDTIDKEINKRKNKWQLTAVSWLDYEDVSQLLRIHINKKFHMWDQARDIEPWLNVIISHQISNLLRNIYGNYSRPCLKCSANEGGTLCSLYTTQCEKCPLFAKWAKTKKRAYDSKLPLPLEHHTQEVFNKPEESFDIDRAAKNLHEKMKTILKPIEYRVYKYLYIEGKKEDGLGKLLGYKTTEKNRNAGYRMIKNIKDSIMKKVKEVLYSDQLDLN